MALLLLVPAAPASAGGCCDRGQDRAAAQVQPVRQYTIAAAPTDASPLESASPVSSCPCCPANATHTTCAKCSACAGVAPGLLVYASPIPLAAPSALLHLTAPQRLDTRGLDPDIRPPQHAHC